VHQLAPPVKNLRILLERSFSACMPLLMATTTFRLRRRRLSSQPCYMHCTVSVPLIINLVIYSSLINFNCLMRSTLKAVFVVSCCSPHLKEVRESQLKVKQLERVIRTLKSKQYVVILSNVCRVIIFLNKKLCYCRQTVQCATSVEILSSACCRKNLYNKSTTRGKVLS